MRCYNSDIHILNSAAVAAVVMAIIISITVAPTGGQLVGSAVECGNSQHGQSVFVPGVSNDACVSCFCKNRTVTCERELCPSLNGCHLVLHDSPSDTCCFTCKGCSYKGAEHASGTTWSDPRDSCIIHTCHAGVVTTSIQKCQAPCSNPVAVEGQCCPACISHGCTVDNTSYSEGDIFYSPTDTCATCTCQAGRVLCIKQACPVLNCPGGDIATPTASCCPRCHGYRMVYLPPNRCLFRKRIYMDGQSLLPDSCTTCVCKEGSMHCERPTCPAARCPRSHLVLDRGLCCPRCVTPKKHCDFNRRRYKHGATWKLGQCRDCVCDDGTVRCQAVQCNTQLECSRNKKLDTVPGSCCPQCVDDEAVCSVFGDPHYNTFDGKMYNFQGSCNYILAQDCYSHTFSIRVRNDARISSDYSWTKTVTVLFRRTRIYLLQNGRVKVNKKRVSLPYVKDSRYSIIQGSHSVILTLALGVKVIWDGDSYLEVTVQPRYKHMMCGLCGNFNNNEYDDFYGKDKSDYFDAKDFAATWQVGSDRACRKRQKGEKGGSSHESVCKAPEERQRATEACSALYSPAFFVCREKLDVTPYNQSCVTDLCDCPPDKHCLCEALTAYARACQRAGEVVTWRNPELCGEVECPRHATWRPCVSDCPRTCDNLNEAVTTCFKPCVASCVCPDKMVLHNNKCMDSSKCIPDTKPEKKKHKEEDKRKKKKKKKKKNKHRGPKPPLIEFYL